MKKKITNEEVKQTLLENGILNYLTIEDEDVRVRVMECIGALNTIAVLKWVYIAITGLASFYLFLHLNSLVTSTLQRVILFFVYGPVSMYVLQYVYSFILALFSIDYLPVTTSNVDREAFKYIKNSVELQLARDLLYMNSVLVLYKVEYTIDGIIAYNPSTREYLVFDKVENNN